MKASAFWSVLKQLVVPNKFDGYAFVLGAVSVLAFAPFNYAPVMIGTLAGFFALLWQARDRLQGFKLGLWFGLGMFGLGVSWLFSSIYVYSGVVLPLAVLLTFGFVLFLALSIALAGMVALSFVNKQRPGLALSVLFPAAWVVGELVRAYLFGGFPFLMVGNTHLHTWLDGYAPVFGVLGMGWTVAITAGLLTWLFLQRAWFMASMSLCLLWSVGGLLQNIEWVKPFEQPIEIALLQGNVKQETKWQTENFMPTLKTYVDLTKQNLGAQVIVWPETAVPSYYDVVEKGALHTFIKDAQLLENDILLGVITRNKETKEYFNAVVNVHNPEQVYQKHHLVPFSEYFPLSSAFAFVSGLFDIPFATFSAGDPHQPPLMLGGQLAGLSICFEMAFGEELARSLPDAKYFITVSNDAWFAHTFEPAQQLEQVQMRALELGREIARATNTGYTVIVDTKGHIKQQIPAYEVGVLRGKIQPYDGLTFFAQWKNLPLMLALLGIFGFILARRYFWTGRLSRH
ncbi:apolipoprotein N-acyltransferase [Thiomicrorhabdus aquaedulcis]|uniref:apolipoprotein N-acyltransferase n=1 Tax=Thiomicrorhabdus aquaedulcis TaxID=2211106 RepID=UPI001E3308E7|nr:apolipoprotein N-acyltransferase [Thiomicrorhabdus aquaedulcis]